MRAYTGGVYPGVVPRTPSGRGFREGRYHACRQEGCQCQLRAPRVLGEGTAELVHEAWDLSLIHI